MSSADGHEAELMSLREKVESLNTLLGTMNQEALQTIGELEERLKDQQLFNTNIMKILEGKGLYDCMQSNSEICSQADGVPHDNFKQRKSHDSPSHASGKHSCATTNSFTQTNLAIDPETSVKMSFISAGISSYGCSIEYSHTKTLLTPSHGEHNTQSLGSTQTYGRTGSHHKSTDRMSPTSLNNEFADRNNHEHVNSERGEPTTSPVAEKQAVGRPPTVPSATTPSRQALPLRSILRTPTQDRDRPGAGGAGPLSSFSPSLSPIHSIRTTAGVGGRGHDGADFRDDDDDDGDDSAKLEGGESLLHYSRNVDEADIEHRKDATSVNSAAKSNNGVNLSASLFMSPLRYDISDTDGSLHSLSLLNVTSNTLASSRQYYGDDGNGRGSSMRESSKVGRRKKKQLSPTQSRRASNGNINTEDANYLYQGGFDFVSGTSTGEERGGTRHVAGSTEEQSQPFRTPTKQIFSGTPSRFAHTTGHSKKRAVNAMGFVKLHHFSEAKPTSNFWKERLGQRDLTSVLHSPLFGKQLF